MIHTCSPSTWEAKTGELRIGEQFELQNKALSQISRNKPNKEKNYSSSLFFQNVYILSMYFLKNLNKWMVLKQVLKYNFHIIAEEIIPSEIDIS